MVFVHVYPVNDIKQHETEKQGCWCCPTTTEDQLVIHNSADGREFLERLNKIITPEEKSRHLVAAIVLWFEAAPLYLSSEDTEVAIAWLSRRLKHLESIEGMMTEDAFKLAAQQYVEKFFN